MNWESPSFVEVKMDAEIGSYQDDFEDVPDVSDHPKTIATQSRDSGVSQAADKLFHAHANSTR